MTDAYRRIARRHLDEDLDAFRRAAPMPPDGWIRSIRESLGMSSADLARRIGVTAQAVRKFERAEVAGTIQLVTIQRVAEALGATLRYAIVPDLPLQTQVEEQSTRAARHELALVDHSMALEQQLPPSTDNERLVAERARELRAKPGLWKRPV